MSETTNIPDLSLYPSTCMRTAYHPVDESGVRVSRPQPWISLCGDWLTGFGFEQGRRLTVQCGWRRLVITVDGD